MLLPPWIDWAAIWDKMVNFDVMTQFTTNEHNPFAIAADVTTDYVKMFDPLYVRGFDTAPAGMWLDIFGDVWSIYYTMYVWTFDPLVAWNKFWMKWSFDFGYTWANWGANLFSGYLTFEMQCNPVMMEAHTKWGKIGYWISAMLLWIVNVIIRFIVLGIFAVFLFILSLQDFIMDIIIAIRDWIFEFIIWPVLDFFLQIHLWMWEYIYNPVWSFIWSIQQFFWDIIWWFVELWWAIRDWCIDLWLQIKQFFIDLHCAIFDWFWSWWIIVLEFIWNIIWFIPEFILEIYFWLLSFILEPIDLICMWWF